MFSSSPFTRFLHRVSAGYYDWLDLREALGIERHYSPIKTFVLFNDYRSKGRALEILDARKYVVRGELFSQRPVHDGFIATLELAPGKSEEDVPARIEEFMRREAKRDAEPFLRECYGEEPTVVDELLNHEVFQFMDYPMFDQGSALVAFGMMITRDAAWLWSRIAFAHK